jgi:hypothetical protein
MITIKRRLLLTPIAALLAVGVSGCAAPSGGFSDLSSTEASEKALPTDLPSNALDGFEVDTVRWIGAGGDEDVWVSEGEQHPFCFLSYSKESWISGCGSGGTYALGAETYWIVPDGSSAPSGAVAISKNVYRSK